MENQEEKSGIEKAGNDLFSFASDREDVKTLMALLPEQAEVKRETVEYELQILKIISAGWSITYFMEHSPLKEPLAESWGLGNLRVSLLNLAEKVFIPLALR